MTPEQQLRHEIQILKYQVAVLRQNWEDATNEIYRLRVRLQTPLIVTTHFGSEAISKEQ